jgi:uncharacterized membrane protein YfcA
LPALAVIRIHLIQQVEHSLTITAMIVGFLVGCTSVGGVLLIPALDAASAIGLHHVMGTALFSFFFGGILGTFLFHKARIIDRAAAKPLCYGALLIALPGALAKEYVSVPVLGSVLAVLILLAGISALMPISRENPARMVIGPSDRRILFALGAGVSFLSAMTGAGGPVLSVPLMLIIGYSPLVSVIMAQPLMVVITFMGSVATWRWVQSITRLPLSQPCACLRGSARGYTPYASLNPISSKK